MPSATSAKIETPDRDGSPQIGPEGQRPAPAPIGPHACRQGEQRRGQVACGVLVVAVGWAVGMIIPVAYGLWALGRLDSLGGAARPGRPPAAEIAGVAGAFGLGWVVGPLPRQPESDHVPPPWARAMAIGPAQQVMFVTSAWSARRLATGALMAGVGVWLIVQGAGDWVALGLLMVWAVFEAAQAHTRLQIDMNGISVTLPWLRLRRTVPWMRIRYAEVRSQAPAGRYKLDDGSWGWGVVSGKGPVLVVSLADERRLVYSTPEANTGAALVNGWLNRIRKPGASSC